MTKKPDNLAEIQYERTGSSVAVDELGMREMQRRVYEEREAPYLLIKAPPASGKSRALMFVGLDKLYNQGRKKVIVAVPERSIGASFATTPLAKHGFFADWEVPEKNNLCTPGSSRGKVDAFVDFLEGPDPILICTHATLRFAMERVPASAFDGTVLAIDEFHHVSADVDSSRLGQVLHEIMEGSDAHIVAMTGSYFRGDAVPVLDPEDEEKFTPVTFNYYDQLNGYQHLKSLGIGHHFYQGKYTDAIHEVFDPKRKTLIHIPSVQSGESTKDKLEEVGHIIDLIGKFDHKDEDGIIHVLAEDGSTVLVADLVDDTDLLARANLVAHLGQTAQFDRDAVDVIIALGMAKEGFDWPFAEHALTVGHRSSLTEVIQIIGRVTRDAEGKPHAQFTNLIAEPAAEVDEVTAAVNTMLKAITASLLMEQVLAPNFKFKTRKQADEPDEPGTLRVKGLTEPPTQRVQQIIETDLNDIKANILQDSGFRKAAAGQLDAEVANKVLIPKILRERYPDLSNAESEALRQHVVVDSVIKAGEVKEVGNKKFVLVANKFVDLDELDINLIDRVNPFQRAFEVLSKSLTPKSLSVVMDAIAETRIEVTDAEAQLAFPKIQNFKKIQGREPSLRAADPIEKRLAEVLIWLRRQKARRGRENT